MFQRYKKKYLESEARYKRLDVTLGKFLHLLTEDCFTLGFRALQDPELKEGLEYTRMHVRAMGYRDECALYNMDVELSSFLYFFFALDQLTLELCTCNMKVVPDWQPVRLHVRINGIELKHCIRIILSKINKNYGERSAPFVDLVTVTVVPKGDRVEIIFDAAGIQDPVRMVDQFSQSDQLIDRLYLNDILSAINGTITAEAAGNSVKVTLGLPLAKPVTRSSLPV